MIEYLRNILKNNYFTHKFSLKIIDLFKIRKLIRQYEKYIFKVKIKEAKKNKKPIQLIVAAGDQSRADWISSEWYVLNITEHKSWKKYFSFNEVDRILAEHVFEHFDNKQTKNCLNNIHNFLKSDGCLRIAVPDGYFPDKKYIDWVKPGGLAPGAEDHKILYNYQTLKKFRKNKFKCKLVEFLMKTKFFYK